MQPCGTIYESILQTINSSLEKGTLPHALLFCGPKSSSKKQCAQFVTKTLLEITNWDHVDVYHLLLDKKADMHKMGPLREFLYETHFPPLEAKRRMFIIHDADFLSEPCMNALLKTLEEPIDGTYFILLCEEMGRLLPTILSRLQVFHFPPNPGEAADEKSPSLRALYHLLEKPLLQGPSIWQEHLIHIENAIEEEKKHVEDSHTIEKELLEHLLFWFRDLFWIQLGIQEQIYHKQHLDVLVYIASKIPELSLTTVHDMIVEAEEALHVHVKFRHALECTLLGLLTKTPKPRSFGVFN